MDALSGNIWFSKLDVTWGYWHIKVKDEGKCKTSFTTKFGLFRFKRMCFGLTNTPSGLYWKTVLAFLDDWMTS